MNDFNSVILLVLALVNVVSLALVALDKQKSMVAGAERTPEVYFFFISVFFASLGTLIGMFLFRHKTRKLYFPVGIGLLLLQQVALVWLVMNK